MLSYLKVAPSNLPHCKILWRNKNASIENQKFLIWIFVTKNAIFGYCWTTNFLKNCSHIWNPLLWISLIAKDCEIMEMPKFGTKTALYEYFWARILKRLLSYLKSTPSNVPICKISRKKKIPKFRTKMEWFMYFWAGTLKEYCHIWNQHRRICLIAKFCEKKLPNFGTNMPYLGIFVQKI